MDPVVWLLIGFCIGAFLGAILALTAVEQNPLFTETTTRTDDVTKDG